MRDIDRQVAHALQVGVDLERGDDQTQIRGHGLLQGEQVHGELVNFDLDPVDPRLVAEHLVRGALVFVYDRADAALDGGFHQRAHLQQLGLQLFQFFDEMAHVFNPQPNRPVT